MDTNLNPRKLYSTFKEKKNEFQEYVNVIKKNSIVDIYSIINSTLIKNPFASTFPKSFFTKEIKTTNNILLFLKSIIKCYAINFYLFFSYIIAFSIYKLFFNKNNIYISPLLIDIFILVDKVNKDKVFNENYLVNLYNVLEKYNIDYTLVARLYQIGKNPFKLIKFFKIINKDKRNIIFEFDLIRIEDFIKLFIMIWLYPFKTLRLLQKELSISDKIFNQSLLCDIAYFRFESLSRYIFGKNISTCTNVKKIYSWSEFQVIERSFNYAIRRNNPKIKLVACQFYLNYEIYLNAYIDDIDFQQEVSPHEVLVNGEYYLQDRKMVFYKKGVSLRYDKIFSFTGMKNEQNIVVLGSYIKEETRYILQNVREFENVLFKNHPAVDIAALGKIPPNIKVVNDNIYNLFENAKIVIGAASGTTLEAVACGISVVIIASQNNLTANPLVIYGKGKIWDISFSKDDIHILYNRLIKYREDNKEEIKSISSWYKENFFVEPTEKNIAKVFELVKELRT